MADGRRIPREHALPVAEALRDELQSVCDRIEIAGSLRREKPTVGDIELVAQPKLFPSEDRDLFGNVIGKPSYRVHQAIDEANAHLSRPKCKPDCAFCEGSGEPCVWGPWLTKLNNGTKYIKLRENHLDIRIDLFLVTPPAEWGPIYAIRTGSRDFSQRLVTGLHAFGLRCQDGRVVRKDGTRVPCPEERDFFRLAGVPWTEPKERR